MDDEYVWDVIWPNKESVIDEYLRDGWEPFGFAIDPDGNPVVSMRRLVLRENKETIDQVLGKYDDATRPSLPSHY